MNEKETITHGFSAVFNQESLILILGSAPSKKSREAGFFYMHPQNRFWKVLSGVYDDLDFISTNIDIKKNALLRHNIALYDVIEKCDIIGSSDSSISNVEPAYDVINTILNNSSVKRIVLAGKTASKQFEKYKAGFDINKEIEIYVAPSTSPANATFPLNKLIVFWQKVLVF